MNHISTKVRSFVVLVVALAAVALPLAGSASANHGDRLLDVDPETETRDVGEEHTITAHLCIKDTSGIPATCDRNDENAQADFTSGPILIDFELESGPNNVDGDTETTPDQTCNINAGESSCSISYTGDGGIGTDVWRVWIDHGGDSASEADPDEPRNEANDTPAANGTNCTGAATPVEGPPGGEPDCTDVVQVTWTEQAGAPATVDCDDETGPDKERETNPSLSAEASRETYTCQVRDANDIPVGDNDPNTMGIQDVVVGAEVENGINDPDSADGASYDSPDYQCTAGDEDDEGDPPVGQCQITVTQGEGEVGTAEICFWIGDEPATECSTEPTNEDAANDTGNNTTGNDAADQVEKTWEARSAAEGDGGLDAEPETATNDTGADHEITATVYDQFGEPFQGSTQVKFEFFTGSPSDGDDNSPGSPDDSCTTLNSSTCSITYTSTDPGRDLVCVWTNNVPAMTGTNQRGRCNGEGLNDGDDEAGEADAPQPRTDDVDVVSKIWTNPDPATEIDCRPETDRTAVGDEYTARCRATNADGAVPGTEIDAEFTGANDDDGNTKGSPDDSCTTGNGGACQITHNPGGGGETGKTLYRAWNDEDYTNNTSEADNSEGRNEGTKPGATAEPDNTDVVSNRWVSGDRSISIHKNKNSVERGESVRIFGEIDANSNDCEAGENVKLKARRPGGNFKTIASQITDGAGEYSFRVKVFRTKDYKAQAPQHNGCDKATSRTIRVRQT